MNTVWQFVDRIVDWEGYITKEEIRSLHRTKEGAEKAMEAWREMYPLLATWKGARQFVQEVVVLD